MATEKAEIIDITWLRQPMRVLRPLFGTGKLAPHEWNPGTGKWDWVEYVDRERNKFRVRKMTAQEKEELNRELKKKRKKAKGPKRSKNKRLKKLNKLRHAA